MAGCGPWMLPGVRCFPTPPPALWRNCKPFSLWSRLRCLSPSTPPHRWVSRECSAGWSMRDSGAPWMCILGTGSPVLKGWWEMSNELQQAKEEQEITRRALLGHPTLRIATELGLPLTQVRDVVATLADQIRDQTASLAAARFQQIDDALTGLVEKHLDTLAAGVWCPKSQGALLRALELQAKLHGLLRQGEEERDRNPLADARAAARTLQQVYGIALPPHIQEEIGATS